AVELNKNRVGGGANCCQIELPVRLLIVLPASELSPTNRGFQHFIGICAALARDWTGSGHIGPRPHRLPNRREKEMVRLRRLELPRGLAHSDLNAARLPIPPQPHASGVAP